MQPIGKKNFASRIKKAGSAEITPSLSSFSLVHRFGKVEIVKLKPFKTVYKEQYFKIPDVPGWCMPELLIGYIKCRKYDFL